MADRRIKRSDSTSSNNERSRSTSERSRRQSIGLTETESDATRTTQSSVSNRTANTNDKTGSEMSVTDSGEIMTGSEHNSTVSSAPASEVPPPRPPRQSKPRVLIKASIPNVKKATRKYVCQKCKSDITEQIKTIVEKMIPVNKRKNTDKVKRNQPSQKRRRRMTKGRKAPKIPMIVVGPSFRKPQSKSRVQQHRPITASTKIVSRKRQIAPSIPNLQDGQPLRRSMRIMNRNSLANVAAASNSKLFEGPSKKDIEPVNTGQGEGVVKPEDPRENEDIYYDAVDDIGAAPNFDMYN